MKNTIRHNPAHRGPVRPPQESKRQTTAKLPSPWVRATRANPCPVCNRTGCIMSSPTDPAAAICIRTKSPRPIGRFGHLHEPWAARANNLRLPMPRLTASRASGQVLLPPRQFNQLGDLR